MTEDIDFTQEELLLMLVDGAVKYTEIARNAIIEGNMEQTHKELVRVQNIFTELMVTLDQSVGQWARDMYRIYDFIRSELSMADIKKDIYIIDRILPVINDVRDTWYEASIKSKE
ncbi:flagellar export chaperone FliS [Clostridioides difficile]